MALHEIKIQANLLLKRKNIFIGAILLLAFVLRVQHVTQPYVDLAGWRECSTAMMAENYYKQNWNILYPEVNWNGPGPSYNGREFQTITYISALLYTVLGQHDWVGRMVAILFGVWGVFALYRLAQISWDEKHALAAALMMTLLPASIFTERSFLPDPATVSLVITGVWMLIAHLQTGRNIYLALAGIITCLGFLTKITGMLVLLPMLYALAIFYKYKKNKLWPVVIAGIVVLIPVISWYLWAQYISLNYPPYHFAGSENWLWDEGIRSWIQQKYFLKKLLFILKEWLWGIPLICLLFIGLSFRPPYSGQNRTGSKTVIKLPFLFHLWLLGCVFFYFIGAKELVGNPWNFHLFSPVVAVFAGRGLILITSLGSRHLVPALFRGVIILCFIVVSAYYQLKKLYTSEYYFNDYKMGLALKEIKMPGDLVVVLGHEIGNPIAIYYSKGRGWPIRPATKEPFDELPQDDTQSIYALEDFRKKGADWFGVVTERFREISANHPLFADHITNHYTLYMQTDEFVIFQMNER